MSITLDAAVAITVAVAAFPFSERVRDPGATAPDCPGGVSVIAA